MRRRENDLHRGGQVRPRVSPSHRQGGDPRPAEPSGLVHRQQIQKLEADLKQRGTELAEARALVQPPDNLTSIKGIGPKTAERIVDHFGLETLDVLDSGLFGPPGRMARRIAGSGPLVGTWIRGCEGPTEHLRGECPVPVVWRPICCLRDEIEDLPLGEVFFVDLA